VDLDNVYRKWKIAMKQLQSFIAIVFYLLAIPNLRAQTKKVTAAEAKDRIGDRATVS
jgi:hypothetical protein